MRFVRVATLLAWCAASSLSAGAAAPAEELLSATFKIFNASSTATGFLVQDTAPSAAPTNVILVSAAHTFAKAKGESVLLVCRTQDAQGQWKRHDHPVAIRSGTNALWTCHPSQDVAVIRCALPPGAVFRALPLAALADESTAKAHGLTVGTPFIYFGYPFRTEANGAAFPILRDGVVSGFPLFPAERYPTFFFSAPTFSGDSGAPVALSQTDSSAPVIVGIIVTRTQQNDKMKSEEWDLTFKRDMQLGSILHAAFVRETIARLK